MKINLYTKVYNIIMNEFNDISGRICFCKSVSDFKKVDMFELSYVLWNLNFPGNLNRFFNLGMILE